MLLGNVFTSVCQQFCPRGGRYPPAKCMLEYTPPYSVHAGIHTPPAQCMLGYTHPLMSNVADGTHPTGIHSC